VKRQVETLPVHTIVNDEGGVFIVFFAVAPRRFFIKLNVAVERSGLQLFLNMKRKNIKAKSLKLFFFINVYNSVQKIRPEKDVFGGTPLYN
jgi:hypothetical protein